MVGSTPEAASEFAAPAPPAPPAYFRQDVPFQAQNTEEVEVAHAESAFSYEGDAGAGPAALFDDIPTWNAVTNEDETQ